MRVCWELYHWNSLLTPTASYFGLVAKTNVTMPAPRWAEQSIKRCSFIECFTVTTFVPKYKTLLQFSLNYKNVLYLGTEGVLHIYFNKWSRAAELESDFVGYLMQGVSHHKSAFVSQAITTHMNNHFSSSCMEGYILDLFISSEYSSFSFSCVEKKW
jgi:hypothetical protein